MLTGSRLVAACLLLSLIVTLAIVGCAGFGPKRAPLASIPDSLDVESKAEALEGMVKQYPKDAEVLYTLGNTYYDQAIPDLARQNYEKAIALDPKMNKARVNLAMLIAESGEPDSAKVMLEDVAKRDPKDTKALVNLGMLYYNTKDFDTAVKYYVKAIAIEPKNAEAHYNLGVAFAESGLLLEAIREWRTVLELVNEGDTAQRARLALERAEGAITK
jgi:cytochrome c-type biogenesis protein CcmH/NrfG